MGNFENLAGISKRKMSTFPQEATSLILSLLQRVLDPDLPEQKKEKDDSILGGLSHKKSEIIAISDSGEASFSTTEAKN